MQVRGKMTNADYFDVWQNDGMEGYLDRIPQKNKKRGVESDEYEAELHDDNKSDVRIICKKCHKTTGWNKADAPGMPGAGVDFLTRRWNEGA